MAGHRQRELWDDFVIWCQARQLQPLPANPWTLAAYLRYLEGRMAPSSMQKVVRAVGRLHREKSRQRPDRHPLVIRTLKLAEQRARERRQAKSKAPALFDEADFSSPPPLTSRQKSRAPSTGTPGQLTMRATPKLVSRRRLKS